MKNTTKYKVTYFYQGLNDFGGITEGRRAIETNSDRETEYYKNALNGHTFGSEYIKTESMIEI